MDTKEVLERLKYNLTNTIGIGAATVLNQDLRTAMYDIRQWVIDEVDSATDTALRIFLSKK